MDEMDIDPKNSMDASAVFAAYFLDAYFILLLFGDGQNGKGETEGPFKGLI